MMDAITPFALPVSDLTNLGQGRAVQFFRRLLWAEAAEVGIGRNLIDVPDCINVADGGIDAVIRGASPTRDDIIPPRTSGFQIKSSDLTPQDCKRELHQREDLGQPIKPEVKRILDDGGHYILVLFADITSQKKTNREKAIIEELENLGYPNPRVRVYTGNQLAGFAERFPSLVVWLRGNIGQCLPYASWGQRHDMRSPKAFISDSERDKWLTEIRDKLRNPNGYCPVFRVVGLAGIGKTRLVFEALSPDDLKNRVIYVTADQFRSSNLHITLQNDETASAIIVIDDCDLGEHDEFVRSFSGRGARLGLLTLSQDMRNVPPPSLRCELRRLSTEKMEELIKTESPQLPDDIVRRLATFADGYPRIGILLVESYLASNVSSDEFLGISDDALMNRLIGGELDTGSDHFRKTKKVLTGLSLFQKIGYEGDLSREAQWLASYLTVPWGDFREVVTEQRQRGIVQGQYYIYVTPFMLRIHLLREWWEHQGFNVQSFNEFVANIPEAFRGDLVQRFFDHIPYVTATKQGQAFAEAILGEDGAFSNGSLLTNHLGSDFFLKLAEADPASALACLKNTIGTWSREKLLEFTIGRREVVWALEKIAVWRNLFPDAARLLLKLGEAENETWSNNASGVFAGLFSPGPAPVAPTEASPEERFPVLKEALESTSKEQRLLALDACSAALRTGHFTRMIGPEYQGLRKEPQLWRPEKYGEIFDSYRRVWQMLREQLDSMPEDEQEKTVDVLLQHARGIGLIANLFDMVIDTLTELSEKPYVKKEKVVATVIQILHYERKELSQEMRQRWEKLRDELIGSDFSSLLRRYVGMDLLEDHFDEKGNYVDQTQPRIEKLAEQAVEQERLLGTNLAWLVASETQNCYRFGYELGKRDKGFQLLTTLLEAQRRLGKSANIPLLGGYFRALLEGNQKEWERRLDALTADVNLKRLIPELTWRSGLTDRAVSRVLNIMKEGIDVASITQLQMFGGHVTALSEDTFKRVVEFLLDVKEPYAVSVVLHLYDRYYVHDKSKYTLPEELTMKVLTHETLFQNIDPRRRNAMDEYNWAIIAGAFIKKYPERCLELADKMLEHFGEEGTIVNSYNSHVVGILNEVTRQNPREVWKLVVKYIGPPMDSRAFYITAWLRGKELFSGGGEGALRIVPLDEIWKWVDQDAQKRARYLATFVPNILFREEGRICLARELLCRYGDRQDVRHSLMANFSTEGWSGPASLHYQRKKQELLDFKKDEDNENVKRWINEYVSSLERQIERETISEERDNS